MHRPPGLIACAIVLLALLAQTFGPEREVRAMALLLDPFANPPICSAGVGIAHPGDAPAGPHDAACPCCVLCCFSASGVALPPDTVTLPPWTWAAVSHDFMPRTGGEVADPYRPHNPRAPPNRS
jgi:hypothetical protein